MSKTVLWLVAGVVVVTAAAAALFLAAPWNDEAPPPVTIHTLEAWVAFTQREGFESLDTRATDDYFLGVYRTAAGEIAFCYRWRGDGQAPNTSFGVRDAQGGDLQDAARRKDATELNATGPLPGGGFVDGFVVPIRTDHAGPVVLEFRDDVGDRGSIPGREVYRQTLSWDR